jgi:hypothetical protein
VNKKNCVSGTLRQSILARSAEPNISEEKAKKLESQAASIVYEDIVMCINVS